MAFVVEQYSDKAAAITSFVCFLDAMDSRLCRHANIAYLIAIHCNCSSRNVICSACHEHANSCDTAHTYSHK